MKRERSLFSKESTLKTATIVIEESCNAGFAIWIGVLLADREHTPGVHLSYDEALVLRDNLNRILNG